MVQNIRLDHLSVSQFVCRFTKLSCGEMVDWILILFGMVRGVGLCVGVLDFGYDR